MDIANNSFINPLFKNAINPKTTGIKDIQAINLLISLNLKRHIEKTTKLSARLPHFIHVNIFKRDNWEK
jgi:hypothetical protein